MNVFTSARESYSLKIQYGESYCDSKVVLKQFPAITFSSSKILHEIDKGISALLNYEREKTIVWNTFKNYSRKKFDRSRSHQQK